MNQSAARFLITRRLKIFRCFKMNVARRIDILTKLIRIIRVFPFASGSILSRDSSFKHLLEKTMNSSRAFVQKPVTVLVIPAVQLLCIAMSVCVNLIRQLTGGVSFEVNIILIVARYIASLSFPLSLSSHTATGQIYCENKSARVKTIIVLRAEKD